MLQVVFFTFWQGFVILVLQHFGILSWGSHNESADAKYVREEAQALLICVEMLGFAVAHKYTFTYKEYRPIDGVGSNDSNADLGHFYENLSNEGEITFEMQDTDNNLNGGNEVQPMSASRALWSALPNEEITDMKRLSRGALYAANKRKKQALEEQHNDGGSESLHG